MWWTFLIYFFKCFVFMVSFFHLENLNFFVFFCFKSSGKQKNRKSSFQKREQKKYIWKKSSSEKWSKQKIDQRKFIKFLFIFLRKKVHFKIDQKSSGLKKFKIIKPFKCSIWRMTLFRSWSLFIFSSSELFCFICKSKSIIWTSFLSSAHPRISDSAIASACNS